MEDTSPVKIGVKYSMTYSFIIKSCSFIALAILFSTHVFAHDIPPENKVAVKEMNDLLVHYFKENCKGINYNSTCPILSDLVPNGKFNTVIAKDYVKNYHFWVFNNQWIWVGHGLFNSLIGGNHKNFQGADGKYFAQGFREFVDKHEQGYYPYVEMQAAHGYKSLAYLHRLTFKDGSELIFSTGYNIPLNMWDKKVLAQLSSKNDMSGHIHYHDAIEMTPQQLHFYKKVVAAVLEFIDQFQDKKKDPNYKKFLDRMNNDLIFSYSHPYRTRAFCNALAMCRDDYVGIKLANMTVNQQNKFLELMKTLLAPYGYQKMITVFARQKIIFDMESAYRDNPEKYPVEGGTIGTPLEHWTPMENGKALPRDSDDYYIAFFGNIEKFTNGDLLPEEGFGIRVEGHHLSINFTFINKNGHLAISTSPTFYGSNPVVVPPAPTSSPGKYIHWKLNVGNVFMLSETQIAKLFIKSLNPEERKAAKYPHMGDAFLESATKRQPLETDSFLKFSQGNLSGLKISDLNVKGSTKEKIAEQKYLLIEFIKLIVATQRDHAIKLQDIISDINNMRVAYYGGTDKFDKFYFRIQSQKFLIELVQSTNFSVYNPGNLNDKNDPKNNGLYNNNHVHIMLRDLRNDWGYDPLQLHEIHDHGETGYPSQ